MIPGLGRSRGEGKGYPLQYSGLEDSVDSIVHEIAELDATERLSLFFKGFPGGSDGKASVYNAGDPGSIPGLGRSPGEGNGNPLQHYCLENLMDRGAWQAALHGSLRVRKG